VGRGHVRGYAALQNGTGERVGGEGSRTGVCGPKERDCQVRETLPTAARYQAALRRRRSAYPPRWGTLPCRYPLPRPPSTRWAS